MISHVIIENGKITMTRTKNDGFVFDFPKEFGLEMPEFFLRKGDTITITLPPFIADAEKA